MILIRLFSKNFNGELISPKAYAYVISKMSAEDLNMHEKHVVSISYLDDRAQVACGLSRELLRNF